MASAPVLGASETVELDDEVFGAKFHEPLVHECVRAELNARRQGTHSTKTRGKVRGGGAKPWRQKGTGRARAGSSRSPIWTGGGTVFAPTPRHYTFKVNRKARKAALRATLSVHAARESIAVVDSAAFDVPSAKRAAELLAGWERDGRTLVVLGEDEVAVGKSFRNLDRVVALTATEVGISDLLRAANVLASREALDKLVLRSRKAAADEGSDD